MTAKSNGLQLPIDAYDLTPEDIERFAVEKRLGVVLPSDQILIKVAEAVAPNKISSARVQQVVERLLAAAIGQRATDRRRKKRRTLVGLAAPQIGTSLRFIVVDTKVGPDRSGRHKLECFINPEIIWRSHETVELREGCFSAGPVWGLVRRSVAVKIRAFTPSGRRTERIFEGFTARIVQHECDHLDGIRFPERIKSDNKRHWVHAEELADYPQHIKHWPRLCTMSQWTTLIKPPS